MSLLLIDISNTRTKLAQATLDAVDPGDKKVIPTADLSEESLNSALKNIDAPDRVILSSVVPKKNQEVLNAFGDSKVLVLHHSLDLGISIDYPNPDSIGADRLANAAAANAIFGSPCVVVDFGTAVTFDILSPEGAYCGGVIAPGLDAMTEYLHRRTALLPEIDLEEPESVIGKSTVQAMLAGAVYGYRGLVKEIIAQISEEVAGGEPIAAVATGGYASLMSKGVAEIGTVHETLTLEGLRIAATRNP